MDDQAFPKVAQQQASPRRPKTLLILALFLILLGGVLFVGSRLLGTKEEEKKIESTRVAPTAIIVPSDTPVPSEEPTPTKKEEKKVSKSPTPTKEEAKTVDSVDKTTGLDRAAITVEILNGSGISGAAGKMSSLLKGLGYVIGSTGNADNFDYQNVTIQVKSTKSKYLTLLKNDISSSYAVGDTNSSLASGSADVVI